MAEDDRILPSDLWPDWNSKDLQSEEIEMIDPETMVQNTRLAIDFLNGINNNQSL